MQIQYFGWSAITLQHGGVVIGFDLYGDDVHWTALDGGMPKLFCLTHGHPEHAGSLQAFLESPDSRPHLPGVHLISSAEVIRHINRNGILPPDNVHRVDDADSVTVAGVTVSTFRWVHMPLLPPGLREKMEYIFQLLTHPVDLFRIGTLGLSLPMNAPQLGFHIAYPDGTTVLNYSEGVHRLTHAEEVKQVAKKLPADVLLFAVEPDDAEAIPQWVEMLDPKDVYIYEAHRPWRDLFHLPFIDLEDYARQLSNRFPAKTFSPLVRVGVLTDSPV